jgi:hypothetical protein
MAQECRVYWRFVFVVTRTGFTLANNLRSNSYDLEQIKIIIQGSNHGSQYQSPPTARGLCPR